MGSCSPTTPDPPDRCAHWHMWCGLCPGADVCSAACSLGKVLMTLITGLVCAINVYFVVDFLPTLQGLGYYIPLGLLLAAYVAFIAYLVRLAPWESGAARGTVHQAHRPALFSSTDLDVQHRTRSLVPGLEPPQPVQLRCLPQPASPGRDPVINPVPHYCPPVLHRPLHDATRSPRGDVVARDTLSKEGVNSWADLPPSFTRPPQVRGCWSRLDAEWGDSGRCRLPLAERPQ